MRTTALEKFKMAKFDKGLAPIIWWVNQFKPSKNYMLRLPK